MISRRAAVIALVGYSALSAALPRGARSQEAVTVADEPTCPTCTITVRQLATLGTADGPGFLPGTPRAVRVDGLGRYWVVPDGEPPLVFSESGSFLQPAGRMGPGPGEFLAPADVLPVAGDSIVVIDWGGPRATVMTPDLRAARTVRLPWPLTPAAVVDWPTLVVMNGNAWSPEAAGWPLHRIAFSGAEAAILNSFGPGLGELQPSQAVQFYQQLAASTGRRFWSGFMVEYRIMQWTADGQLVRSFRRDPDWFSGRSGGRLLGSPTTPPEPALTAIHEDSEGLLWAFVRVPTAHWRRAWSDAPVVRGEIRTRDLRLDELFRTVIEVIDPDAAAVVVRHSLDAFVVAALPGRRAALYAVNAEGVPQVSIVAFNLGGR